MISEMDLFKYVNSIVSVESVSVLHRDGDHTSV